MTLFKATEANATIHTTNTLLSYDCILQDIQAGQE